MAQTTTITLEKRQLGFAQGGALSSRTAMIEEFETVLLHVAQGAPANAYQQAILDDNILHKATASNREKTFKFLRRLYALDPNACLFRELRQLQAHAANDLRLLIGLLAMAREPFLRECRLMVQATPIGASLGRQHFEDWIRCHAPGQYSEAMYISFSHNLYASFYQMGYLGESIGKARTRVHPKVGIACATYAAFLDWLTGASGIALLQAPYSSALDLATEEHLALLAAAGRQGLLKTAYSGGVLDLSFPGFLTADESRPSS